jgi:hypothetical protein
VAIDRENYPGKSIQLSMGTGVQELQKAMPTAARTKTGIGFIVAAITIFIACKSLKGRTSPSHSATPVTPVSRTYQTMH